MDAREQFVADVGKRLHWDEVKLETLAPPTLTGECPDQSAALECLTPMTYSREQTLDCTMTMSISLGTNVLCVIIECLAYNG